MEAVGISEQEWGSQGNTYWHELSTWLLDLLNLRGIGWGLRRGLGRGLRYWKHI